MVDPSLRADAAVRGGCLCGQVRYEVHSLPLDSLYCQCRDCQIDSGTGRSCHLMVASRSFSITGDAKLYYSVADGGDAVYRGFCPNCGSSLIYSSSRFPDAIFVTAGSLDDPGWFRPTMIVYTSSAQAWDHLDATLRRFELMPPSP